MIRTINEYQNLEEIADTMVFGEEGREIRVRDLGQVVHGQRDREMMTKTDGNEDVQVDIYKEADANMIRVAEDVNDLVGEISGSSRSTTRQLKTSGRGGRLSSGGGGSVDLHR